MSATQDIINRYAADYKLIFVGDATMSSYDILSPRGSIEFDNRESWSACLRYAYLPLSWLTHLKVTMSQSLIEARLQTLGIQLPPVSAPAAAYVMAVQSGALVFLSGHIARRAGQPWVGKLGKDMNTETGKAAARGVAIDLIATLKAQVGSLDRVKRIVKVMGLVNSTETFTDQHLVINGCSELLFEVFAQAGQHARSAFGVSQIPLGACVEIELIAEIE